MRKRIISLGDPISLRNAPKIDSVNVYSGGIVCLFAMRNTITRRFPARHCVNVWHATVLRAGAFVDQPDR